MGQVFKFGYSGVVDYWPSQNVTPKVISTDIIIWENKLTWLTFLILHFSAPISTNANFVIDPMMLQKRIRRRMLSHQEELDSLKTRKERLRFIRNLSNPNALNHPFDSDVRDQSYWAKMDSKTKKNPLAYFFCLISLKNYDPITPPPANTTTTATFSRYAKATSIVTEPFVKAKVFFASTSKWIAS